MIRRREESSTEEESACEAVFEFVLEIVFVCVIVVLRSRRWEDDWARRAASAVGERRPMPWERRMRE